ncbi:MAG: hypothetical protein QOH43_3057 [Solirubrobacteraceae bacterium]|jgi:hypothetical protein|nr:hypothetical protein [Solirubrobacteraceae bacterium]
MTTPDGRNDFDFVFGAWEVSHRRLVDMLDPECDVWETFSGTSRAEPVLDGIGNVDRLWVPATPGGPPLEGFTLRLFEPDAGTWRIWWSSTTRPGRLDPPVEGRFVDGVGRFDTEDVIDGVAIGVRFGWRDTATPCPRWDQQFSFDGGRTWRTTWTMDHTRSAA